MDGESDFTAPHGKVPHVGHKFGNLSKTEDNSKFVSALERSWYTGVSKSRLAGLLNMGCPKGKHCKLCHNNIKGRNKQWSKNITYAIESGADF